MLMLIFRSKHHCAQLHKADSMAVDSCYYWENSFQQEEQLLDSIICTCREYLTTVTGIRSRIGLIYTNLCTEK